MLAILRSRWQGTLCEIFERDGDAMVDLVENMGRAKDFFSHLSGASWRGLGPALPRRGQRLPKHAGKMRRARSGMG